MNAKDDQLEIAVRDARAEYLDCRRRLDNIINNQEAAERLLSLVEEYGTEAALRELMQNPTVFCIALSSPMLLSKTQAVLKQTLSHCEQAQWELDDALTRRERRRARLSAGARQVFAFGGREAEVDFDAGSLVYRDGGRETLRLEIAYPENERQGARRR